jgi:penicillin-binding protein 2
MAMAALNTGKRSPGTMINDGGTFSSAATPSAATATTAWAGGHAPLDRQVEQRLLLLAGQRDGRGPDPRAAQPLGFGARPASTSRARSPACCRPPTGSAHYKKPEQQRWYAGETISLGIGQGYNNFTMLQLASATATLVSGGQRFKPRLVREVEDVVTASASAWPATRWSRCRFKPEHVA